MGGGAKQKNQGCYIENWKKVAKVKMPHPVYTCVFAIHCS